MCLICVEYFNQRMTRDEVKNALPEMILFAKNDDDKKHYQKLQSLESPEEMEEEVKNYIKKSKKIERY